jgi:hypothetical protein
MLKVGLIDVGGYNGAQAAEQNAVRPTAHSGSASDAFDVVVRSIPGYGSSGKPALDSRETGRHAEQSQWADCVSVSRLGIFISSVDR